jgi:hypothetical protein
MNHPSYIADVFRGIGIRLKRTWFRARPCKRYEFCLSGYWWASVVRPSWMRRRHRLGRERISSDSRRVAARLQVAARIHTLLSFILHSLTLADAAAARHADKLMKGLALPLVLPDAALLEQQEPSVPPVPAPATEDGSSLAQHSALARPSAAPSAGVAVASGTGTAAPTAVARSTAASDDSDVSDGPPIKSRSVPPAVAPASATRKKPGPKPGKKKVYCSTSSLPHTNTGS